MYFFANFARAYLPRMQAKDGLKLQAMIPITLTSFPGNLLS